MSALSIPPSQKTNISVGLEAIHNYANVLNPVTFVGADQYSVVAVYTEVEVGVSDVNEEVIESAAVQVHTDFYEEEIVAVSADNLSSEETGSLRAEETSETADVAKALETLTKTFALRKESLGQDVPAGKSQDSSLNDECASGNDNEEGKANEPLETSRQTNDGGETTEEVTDKAADAENGNSSLCTEQRDDHESLGGHEEMTDVSSAAPAPETQQNTRRSSRLQMKTPHNWQEIHKFKRSFKETTEEPKT